MLNIAWPLMLKTRFRNSEFGSTQLTAQSHSQIIPLSCTGIYVHAFRTSQDTGAGEMVLVYTDLKARVLILPRDHLLQLLLHDYGI